MGEILAWFISVTIIFNETVIAFYFLFSSVMEVYEIK